MPPYWWWGVLGNAAGTVLGVLTVGALVQFALWVDQPAATRRRGVWRFVLGSAAGVFVTWLVLTASGRDNRVTAGVMAVVILLTANGRLMARLLGHTSRE